VICFRVLAPYYSPFPLILLLCEGLYPVTLPLRFLYHVLLACPQIFSLVEDMLNAVSYKEFHHKQQSEQAVHLLKRLLPITLLADTVRRLSTNAAHIRVTWILTIRRKPSFVCVFRSVQSLLFVVGFHMDFDISSNPMSQTYHDTRCKGAVEGIGE